MIFRAGEAYFRQKQQHMPSLRDGREHLAHLREEAQMADAEGEDRKRGESYPEKKGKPGGCQARRQKI